jgi:hypothetical protein
MSSGLAQAAAWQEQSERTNGGREYRGEAKKFRVEYTSVGQRLHALLTSKLSL